jgi:hypothetical protein
VVQTGEVHSEIVLQTVDPVPPPELPLALPVGLRTLPRPIVHQVLVVLPEQADPVPQGRLLVIPEGLGRRKADEIQVPPGWGQEVLRDSFQHLLQQDVGHWLTTK